MFKRMVWRSVWGICSVNSRYPDRMQGIRFYQIPNPKTKLERYFRLEQGMLLTSLTTQHRQHLREQSSVFKGMSMF